MTEQEKQQSYLEEEIALEQMRERALNTRKPQQKQVPQNEHVESPGQ